MLFHLIPSSIFSMLLLIGNTNIREISSFPEKKLNERTSLLVGIRVIFPLKSEKDKLGVYVESGIDIAVLFSDPPSFVRKL